MSTRVSFSEAIAASMRGAAAAARPERARPSYAALRWAGYPDVVCASNSGIARRVTDGRECADRGAARHPAHVERELVGQRHNRPFVPEIAKRTHRREPDVEILVVDPTDERHSGVLHPQATERPGRRDSHRRLTVAQGRQ